MLLVEAFFIPPGKKSSLALIGVIFLTIIFFLENFVVSDTSSLAVGHWMERFYAQSPRALLFKNIAIVSSIFVLIMGWQFRGTLNKFTSTDNSDVHTGEFYCLPLFACVGMMWMASAVDFVSIFVSLELVTICFYVMVSYLRRNVGSLEAGVKYLILGALSTGILVYGIAWIYGAFGTTQIDQISAIVATQSELSIPALFGLSLCIIAISFKVGAVPMQLWIPDVYQGAPTPVTAFLSVASKASGFAIAITIFEPFLRFEKIQTVFLIIAGATLIYGNFAALAQHNFKRLLAYSSIAHAGFILIAMGYGNFGLVAFYLVTYLLMTFAAFFILNAIDGDEIESLNGLSSKSPFLALMLTITMCSMAGLPLTVGFYGKFLVFKEILNHSISIPLLIICFISVACGFYYYLKVIKAIYWKKPAEDSEVKANIFTRAIICLLVVSLIIFGFVPRALQYLTQF